MLIGQVGLVFYFPLYFVECFVEQYLGPKHELEVGGWWGVLLEAVW